MHLFFSKLILLDGWQRYALAFLAGALASLAQQPLALLPVLWIALPVLVLMLDSAALGHPPKIAARAMAKVGWMFGFGFFSLTFYWLGAAFLVEADKFAWAMPLAVLVLPAGLALFWALACGLCGFLWSSSPLRVFWLALSLSALEWLRGTVLTGLPWGGIGPAYVSNNLTMQALALVGPDSMVLLAVLVFCLPIFLFVEQKDKMLGRALALVAGILFVAQAGFGLWRLSMPVPTDEAAPVVRLVQPNIPQKEKWKFENRSWIFNRLLGLTTLDTADHPLSDVDLVIWPESAVPFYLIEQPGGLAAIANALPDNAELITGALRREIDADGSERVFNSMYSLASDGTILSSYDKVHLVPFGEYLPLRSVLSRLGLEQLTAQRSGFSSGAKRSLLENDRLGAFLPLICYEIAFSSEVLRFPKGAKWIVNVTNDAWFGATAGPWQHLHLAQMRAVETGLPVVRVANTGISAIIDSRGNIEQSLTLGSDGIIQGKLPSEVSETFYNKGGNLIFFTLWAFFCVTTASIRRKVT